MGKRNTHSLCAFAHKTTVDTVDGPNVCVSKRERDRERKLIQCIPVFTAQRSTYAIIQIMESFRKPFLCISVDRFSEWENVASHTICIHLCVCVYAIRLL